MSYQHFWDCWGRRSVSSSLHGCWALPLPSIKDNINSCHVVSNYFCCIKTSSTPALICRVSVAAERIQSLKTTRLYMSSEFKVMGNVVFETAARANAAAPLCPTGCSTAFLCLLFFAALWVWEDCNFSCAVRRTCVAYLANKFDFDFEAGWRISNKTDREPSTSNVVMSNKLQPDSGALKLPGVC